jgi:hypothetical protein
MGAMAFVNFDGLNLRVTLAPPERRAVHEAEFVVPRENLASVAYEADVWDAVQHNISLLGLGYPRMILWGTAWTKRGSDFCILHRPGPGLVIGLHDHPYDRVLLSLAPKDAWPLFARLREVIEGDAARSG